MKTEVVFLILTCVAFTVPPHAKASKQSKPSATLEPPAIFTEFATPDTSAKTTMMTKPPTTTKITTTIKPTTTTTTAKTTTAKTTTTTKPTTTTTTAKTTTTTKPTTTTTTAKTTTTPNSTTTTKATTTTAKIITTTKTTPVPRPTPSTNVTLGSYEYMDKKQLYFKANMALRIRVNDSKVGGVFIVPPNKTVATGKHSPENVTVTLKFGEGFIRFVFKRNMTTKTVYASCLELNLTYAFKDGVKGTYSAKNESMELFKAAIGHAYSCKNESIFLGNQIFLDVSQDQVQAFNFTNNQFGKPDFCKADQTDYTVAIAVGVVLLILIIIVILAYICSRRRRVEGYQSL